MFLGTAYKYLRTTNNTRVCGAPMKLKTMRDLPARLARVGRPKGKSTPVTEAVLSEASESGMWVLYPTEYLNQSAARSSANAFRRMYPAYEFVARNGRLYCRRKPEAKS